MKCGYCGSKTRNVVTEAVDVYYIVCNKCKNVIYTAPEYIPTEQEKRYLDRIVKGKPNDL
jgi:transcription initiation factor TFIIIB Brf1 subunit/transcription initiation factor TFIIB